MKRITAIGLLVALALVIVTAACSKDQFSKAAHMTDGAAQSIGVLIDEKRGAAQNGEIDQAEEAQFTHALADANNALYEVADRALLYDTLDDTSRRDLREHTQAFITTIDTLLADGTLHIKNARRQQQVRRVIEGVRVGLIVYDIFDDSEKNAQAVPIPPELQEIFSHARDQAQANRNKLNEDLARLTTVQQ